MNLAATLEPYLHCRRWLVAYSGGVDSHVLLRAVTDFRDRESSVAKTSLPTIAAIHVNHQIHPRAAEWAQHCQKICADLNIELIVEKVAVVRDSGLGLEAAARAARYAAFQKHLGAQELLLQAHHRDDQTETVLLRLLRGSGMKGLAAIPAQRELGKGQLLRPFLSSGSPITRAQIIAYAQRQQLTWIHDDSNDDSAYDRNFLRLRVLPLLAERWPAYRETLQRTIDNATESAELLKELAALDYANTVTAEQSLSIDSCLKLSAARQRNLIFYWLQQQRLSPPSSEQMAQVLAMLSARDDAQPCVNWPGVELRRFRSGLFASKPLADLPADFEISWNPAESISIEGVGSLRASPVSGAGLRGDRQYRVQNRRGGERCRPQGRAHSQTLKKLLQELDIEPWLRDRLPIIYCGDEIAAVADLWICEDFVAAPNESGWHIEWRRTI